MDYAQPCSLRLTVVKIIFVQFGGYFDSARGFLSPRPSIRPSIAPLTSVMRLMTVMIVMFCQLFYARQKDCHRELFAFAEAFAFSDAPTLRQRNTGEFEDKSAAGSFIGRKFDTSFDWEILFVRTAEAIFTICLVYRQILAWQTWIARCLQMRLLYIVINDWCVNISIYYGLKTNIFRDSLLHSWFLASLNCNFYLIFILSLTHRIYWKSLLLPSFF